MEEEYKWQSSPDEMEQLRQSPMVQVYCTETAVHTMDAAYYDTEDALFHRIHAALRLRQEDGVSICCLKQTRSTTNHCALREEYEVPAATIEEGLRLLPDVGAPQSLCDTVLAQPIIEQCRTVFTRTALTLHVIQDKQACTMELAFDIGYFLRNGMRADFSEIELEYKNGATPLFHTYARKLEQRHALIPEPYSKLARAMALSGTGESI